MQQRILVPGLFLRADGCLIRNVAEAGLVASSWELDMHESGLLIGNLRRDPEVRTFPNGVKVTSLSLATSERWKDRQTGEVREKSEWHRVEVKNDFLANIASRLRKGMTVCVAGRLEIRKWQDNRGLYVPNVRDLGGSGRDGGEGSTDDGVARGPDLDDEVPF